MEEGESAGKISFDAPLKTLQTHFCGTIHFPDQMLFVSTVTINKSLTLKSFSDLTSHRVNTV